MKLIDNIVSMNKIAINVISGDNLKKDFHLSKSFWATHTEIHKTKRVETKKNSESPS